jgi:hypothetical protein
MPTAQLFTLPTDLIEQLEGLGRHLERTRSQAAALLADLGAAERAVTDAPADLLKEAGITLPSPAEFAKRCHHALIDWAERTMSPGVPLTLDRIAIEDVLRHDYKRGWEDIFLAETARYLIETYGADARQMAARQVAVKLRRAIYVSRIRPHKGSLILYAPTSLESWSSERRMSYGGIKTVIAAVTALADILVLSGAAPDGFPGVDCQGLNREFTDGFDYRRKVPFNFGHIVLFKEHVDIVVAPPYAEVLALFCAEYLADDEAA